MKSTAYVAAVPALDMAIMPCSAWVIYGSSGDLISRPYVISRMKAPAVLWDTLGLEGRRYAAHAERLTVVNVRGIDQDPQAEGGGSS